MPTAMEKKPAKPKPKTPSQRTLEKVAKESAEKAVAEFIEGKIRCYMCGDYKSEGSFYRTTDPMIKPKYAPICRHCTEKIVYSIGSDNQKHPPTKQSVQTALFYLNKPFLDSVWDSSVTESSDKNSGKVKSDVWNAYIKNISMINYNGMTYLDGDNVNGISSVIAERKVQNPERNKEILDQYEQNKKDVLNLIGYDPFESYPIDNDKPILYSQLVNFIDEETKNDGMKLGAVIQIVKKLNQAEKLNDQIDAYIADPINASKNMPLINKMADSYKKIMDSANALAKDNGISVNHNNSKSKGASTLSGKIKQLTEMGLWEAKINSFDIGTCEGMRQVAELSEEARHKQIGYDENIALEIKDIKVELVETLTKERDRAVEEARLLLLENKQLKDFLLERGLVDENYKVIDA